MAKNHIDYDKAAKKAFKNVQEGLVDNLNASGGLASRVKSEARDIARTAVEDAIKEAKKNKLKAPKGRELKAIFEGAYDKAFRNKGHELLAQKGHIGSSIRNMFHAVGSSFGNAFKSISGNGKAVKPGLTSRLSVKPLNWLNNGMRRHPVVTALATLGTLVYAGATFVGNRNANQAQAEYDQNMQNLAGLNMQTAMAEQQAAMSYKNTLRPGEFEEVEAAMRNNGQRGGHVQAYHERLAAAQQGFGLTE